ncbi:ubiquitin-specific protease 2B [Salix suchowensis]|nr:ubiquitin-specific protease 2B [Salix suchowensis]
MDEEYDVIVLGTGLKECIPSGESTSLNLSQLWKRFRGSDQPPESLGASKECNVYVFTLSFSFVLLVYYRQWWFGSCSDTHRCYQYLNFKAIDGSFVYNKGKIHKVLATDVEALKSPLMGLFEKRRARKFFIYVQDYEDNDPKSHEGLDLTKVTAREVISKYGLEDDTIDFIGHALALHLDDSYLDQPALVFVTRMKLYAESLASFQGGSPYIYPLHGLAELPQSFARLSAVFGGIYMLNKPECKVEFDESGKAIGVTSEGEIAKCKKVVCDPSYLPNKKQLGRKSDVYLFCCSYAHNAAPKGKYIAFVSTEAKTDNPEIFYDTHDRYVPANEEEDDNCFISTKVFSITLLISFNIKTHLYFSFLFFLPSLNTKLIILNLKLGVDLNFGGCTEAVKIERSNEPINIDDGPIDVDTGGETDALRKGKSDEVVDIDTIIIDKQCQYSVSVRARMPQEHCADKDEISQMVTFMIDEDDGPIDVDTRGKGMSFAGEINTLCKGKSDEVVDIDTTILDDQSECSVSVPARMSKEDCVVKEEISKLGTLGIDIDDGPLDVATGVAGETDTLRKGNSDEVVDIDTIVIGHQCQYSVSVPACMPPEDCDDNEISQLDTLRLSSFSNSENESASMISDNDVRIEMSSSASVYTPSEDEGNQVIECGSLGHQIDYTNNTVAVFPDYILCGNIYGTEACLTFSGSSIRMKGSTVNGVKGIFNAEWNLDDIISIESEWCEMVTTAMVYLCLKSKVSEGARIGNDASDVDKLKFSVYDPHWHEGEEAIKSLDVRYKDIWNFTSESDLEKDRNVSSGHNGMFTSKPYFPVVHETFEEVVYPKGDPDAVSISKRDVDLLRPETFINDTIIDFYIQYLKNKIQPDDRQRFHFFNSFFFRKLADLDKGPSNACEGRIAFQRVCKWTRKLNIFEKDYIFIPVNYSLHWSLIVICHPGEVVHSRDDESGNSLKVPCILHMDSIRGSHKGLKNLIQSYLYEEWRERHNETVDDTLSKFLHLRFVPLELPQQGNLYDCGLFLLHYVELFLEEAPIDFSPFKITEFSNFLSRNWFLPGEASLKRAHIQKLICEILEDQSCTPSSDPNEQETGAEFLEEVCSAVSGPDTDT